MRRLARIAITMAISFAISGVTIFLGFWQYDRHLDRADALANYEVAEQLAPEQLSELVPAGASELPDGVEWRTITATGTFDPDSLRVLRTRPVAGTGAWQYLAWLEADNGQSLQVGLGWIPQPGPDADPPRPNLDPSTPVTVTGIMRVWEPDDGKESGDTVSRIAPEQLPAATGDAVPGYLMLREWCDSTGCVETPVGQPVPLPTLTLGPHLAYAWQWWLFAAMAPVAGVLLLRRDTRLAASRYPDLDTEPRTTPEVAVPEVPVPAKPTRASAPRKRKRELSDEEIEDAL